MNAADQQACQLDALLSDFADRLRRGEQPSVDDYALRYPDLGEAIRELFPTVQGVEELKRQRRAASQLSQAKTPSPGNRGDTQEAWPAAEVTVRDLTALFRPAQSPDEIGRLGSYRILRLLGHGGMGAVLVAEDLRLHRTVALKVMLPGLARQAKARERFLREARLAASIEHAHIVAIYQVDEDHGVPFIAMPLLKGTSLAQRLQSPVPLRLPEIVAIATQVAGGLTAAHARGLIHRDVKPANIWLETPDTDADGADEAAASPGHHVKLLDFGLARALSTEVDLTHSGMALGTPTHMAPEQARGEAVDARADLFSLGVVLYRLTTGQLPFQGKTPLSVMMVLASHTPPAPRAVEPSLPPALSHLVMQLLEKDRARRPTSAREVVARLHSISAALPDPTMAGPSRLAPHRRRRVAWVGAALLLLLLGPLAYWLAGSVLRIESSEGTLIVKIHDANLVVSVNGAGRASISDKSAQRTFSFQAQKGEVHVFDKDGKQLLVTKQFEVRKGEHTTLEVTANEIASAHEKVLDKTGAAQAGGAWRPLFNGKDLAGWKLHPAMPGDWNVKDGALVGRGPRSLLFSERGDFGDFHLRFQAQINAGGDSGIFFWTTFAFDRKRDPTDWHEANIGSGGTGSLNGQGREALVALTLPADEWFTMEVIAAGPLVTTKVNGQTRASLRFPEAKKGHLALQVYANSLVNTIVQFRKIEAQEP